ncbi:YdcF family protein [Chachezhania sediminis]|uniref:YdcF family protein n=1 Tax=Chachezhania sediminis TaxID=2599291 RepID=UPI00131CC4E5|nr:YdcF family protein [Chachezhania sediminis]
MDSVLFILYKSAFYLIRADTLLILLASGTFVCLLAGRLRPARWMAGILCLTMLAIATVPVGRFLMLPLERSYPPDPDVDDIAGIIVLGGAEEFGASTWWNHPLVNDGGERFTEALALSRRFPAAPVLFTGGLPTLQGARPGARNIGEWVLTDLGIDPARLVIEPASRNTAENARFLLEMSPDGGGRPWLLVTSGFHMRRSVETFCQAGWTKLVPWPTDFRTTAWNGRPDWAFSSHLAELILAGKEWLGLLGYRLTGRGTDPKTVSCLAPGIRPV